MNANPLGKYAEVVSAFVSVFVILAAVLLHAYEAIIEAPLNTTFIDNVALIAVGVLFGGRAVANGAKESLKEPLGSIERDVLAAHTRLDRINAPPANDGEKG